MSMMTGLENSNNSIGLMEAKGLNRKGFSTNVVKRKAVGPVIAMTDGSMSEEDEPSYNEDVNGENSNGDGKSISRLYKVIIGAKGLDQEKHVATSQLHEERLKLQSEAFELEKQRFKWLRYCNKKDRELQRLRLENKRKALENKQSILQLRQKELEISYRRSYSPLETLHGIDRLQGKVQIDMCNH
ncbi:ADP/ATP carrier 2 isoform 1 [Hibiscus syriacus]|uniref:ADP/ATP carrier 2 isoform 1 n=1 Tax=Hibiscus syriacus TaxID=106335 RepID=A0A6A2X7U8_HIBSY|nr:ADP/ATP carrier 2 isoform 1 [Hibiscus syriacus]